MYIASYSYTELHHAFRELMHAAGRRKREAYNDNNLHGIATYIASYSIQLGCGINAPAAGDRASRQ